MLSLETGKGTIGARFRTRRGLELRVLGGMGFMVFGLGVGVEGLRFIGGYLNHHV